MLWIRSAGPVTAMVRLGALLAAIAAVSLVALTTCVDASGPLTGGTETRSADQRETVGSADPDWLEPRGINIVDLVGEVPEEYLQGAIVSFGFGIVRYESGTRSGDTVVITTTAYPRHAVVGNWDGSLFGCLGHLPYSDELGSVSPPATVRVYTPEGQEVTRQVDYHDYIPSGLVQPALSPQQSQARGVYRYALGGWRPTAFDADGALVLPGNMGCQLIMSYTNYKMLKVVFTLQSARAVAATVLGSQQFESAPYTGPGNVGFFNGLRDQLRSACTVSSSGRSVSIPGGANFFFVNFPPLPVDPYTTWPANPLENADRPSSGTYRIRTPIGLSVDHVITTGLPLYGHWIDLDVASADTFLPYSQVPSSFEPPEYVVPAGVSYDACMLTGTCPAEKLHEICDARTSVRMIYLRIETILSRPHRIAVRIPGASWQPGVASASASPSTAMASEAPSSAVLQSAANAGDYHIYLPAAFVSYPEDESLACDPRGGLGRFSDDGRMVGYRSCESSDTLIQDRQFAP